jgi:hypothetical protein
MDGPTIPAGWYADPTGNAKERWWDGSDWTARTRDRHEEVDNSTTEGTSGRAATVAPGWYVDPTGAAALRWWDGTAWTDRIKNRRESASVRKLSHLAAVTAVFLLLGGVGFFGGRWLLTGERDDGTFAIDRSNQSPTAAAEDRTSGNDLELEEPESSTPAGDGSEPNSGPESQDPSNTTTEPVDPLLTINFDGVCDAQVPRSIAEAGGVRPWNVGCATAPVSLEFGPRWIIVVASLNGADTTESDARDRAASVGLSGKVLWSSHYPSLNPNLWVVYDGPYLDEATARASAQRRGADSYARTLSDSEGDRYCLAADGCVGERAN